MAKLEYRDSAGTYRVADGSDGAIYVKNVGAGYVDTAGGAFATDGSEAYSYDGSGNLQTITVTDGIDTWVQTHTWSTGKLQSITGWVKQ